MKNVINIKFKPTVYDFLSKGYIAKELPPVFNTKAYADFYKSCKVQPYSKDTQSVSYRLARPNQLPRVFSIPNPESYTRLSEFICDNWKELNSKISQEATILSRPSLERGQTRAIGFAYKFSSHPYMKLTKRTEGRFLVKADISKFYPSIYTHSIPWSIDGKSKAKTQSYRKQKNNLANKLDTLVRNCQYGETKGISIGPDSSYLVGELIMSSIDKQLHKQGYKNYTRMTDDFEFIAETREDAEGFLSFLAARISEFGLEINDSKTGVFELPCSFDDVWVRRIKAYIFSPDTKTSTILEFFDEVFYLARTYPKSSVLKFALSYILNANDGKGFDNVSSNTLVQFSLQCALYEAGCLEHCFKIVKRCEQRDFINYGMILSTLERIIQKHAPLNHSSEVCWSLWAINELSLIGMYTQSGGLKLANQTVDALLLADDCCILTLGMYLHQKLNIFGSKITNTHKWYEILHDPEGYDDYWMYWYEGITRGWVKQVTTIPAKYAVLIKASQANISFLK